MNLKLSGIASIVTVLAACSSQPQQPAANASTPPPAAPAAALASPAAAAPAPAISRELIAAGYRPKTIKGEVFYCRKEDVTNTAFKKTVCLNEAQLKDEERRIKELQREMIRSQPNPSCMGPTCAG